MSETEEPVSVFLIAQNRLVRESLTRILEKTDDIRVTGAGAFSTLVTDQILAAAPDVLLMDAFAASHLEFVREVQRKILSLKIVMIGMPEDEQSFLQAVRWGASGYVLEDAPSMEIVAAVRAVVNGRAVCPPEMSLCLFRQVSGHWNEVPSFAVKTHLGLTTREQQLVFLLGRGLTNKEIASQLQLAEQTVRNHVHHMLRKLRASDRLAVVEMCRMEGLPV